MPIYKYHAKKGPEEVVEGNIEAHSQDEAIEKLSQQGYLPLRIEQQEEKSTSVKVVSKREIGRVRGREITIVSRQLASLLKAGVSILNSLSIIAEQSENIHLRNLVYYIYNEVRQGATFSQPLSAFPKIFSPLYVAMVRTGEDSGSLPETLLRIAEYRFKEEEMMSRFRMAMAYPILMAIVGFGTIVFMFVFVMPRLMQIYLDVRQDLPVPTKILLGITKAVKQWGGWLAIGAVIVILLLRRQAKTKSVRLHLSQLKLRLPVFGEFALKQELARFCLTLELLIHSGIPILRAIEIAIPVLSNEVIKEQLRSSHKALEAGGSFGRSLKESKVFPLFMSNLLIVGEESGKLSDSLKEIGSSYERDTEEALKVFATLLEPLMILVMGLIVGFIVMAMLLPIFEINLLAT
ncbi:MAG: type II secretion system F family protein [Candidatus Omnitrophica bacterium]|nr:type II secretion system F family protein [Candidatus Omnitrophota bacterium]